MWLKVALLCGMAFFSSSLINAAAIKSAIYRDFWHPCYHGARLGYCTLDNKTCGMAVARKYCKMMGYQGADQEMIAPHVGLTHLLGDKITCKGWTCDGFKMIRCFNVRLRPYPP